MSFVEPARPRCRIEDTFDGLEITIPASRMWFASVFLAFWLMGWAVGEVFAITILVAGLIDAVQNGFALMPHVLVGGFLLVWLCGWTVGGLMAVRGLLWNIGGREVVTVGRVSLRIEQRVPLWSRSKDYNMMDVAGLRLSQQPDWPWGAAAPMPAWGNRMGSLAFDYGAGTIRFAAGLQEAEAKRILRQIGDRFPKIIEDNAAKGDKP